MQSQILLGLLGAAAAGLAGPGCGHCDGALRNMRAVRAEWRHGAGRGGCKQDGARDGAGQPRAIGRDETFRLIADGPRRAAAELQRLSGVDERSWVLFADATGQPVPASVTADAGGHVCLRGVGFVLRPRRPLAPGGYTLVLQLDRVRWPIVEAERRTLHAGQPALVRRFEVRAD